jgi:hypothetical protein
MTPSPDPRDPLERFVHQALREVPSRRAPRTLESRVLAELARRAALPWWRKSFVHWPIAARGLFIVFSAGFVKLALMAAVWIMAGFDSAQFTEAFSTQFAWMETGVALIRAVTESAQVIFRSIPTLWLYGGLAFIGALYFALFGLGAAAYRTLYVSR